MRRSRGPEGGGCWEQEPCAGCQPGGFGACRDWCSSTFCGGNTSLFLGVVGFKGSPNLGRDGSFGFQQGVNFGTVLPFWPESGVGWQVGVRTIQANIAGTSFGRRGTAKSDIFYERLLSPLSCGIECGVRLRSAAGQMVRATSMWDRCGPNSVGDSRIPMNGVTGLPPEMPRIKPGFSAQRSAN